MKLLIIIAAFLAASLAVDCPAQIKICYVYPVTGTESGNGLLLKEGYDFGFDAEIPKTITLTGCGTPSQVVHQFFDDQSSTAVTATQTQAAITAGCKFILGSSSSGLVAAQAPVAQQGSTIFLNGAASASTIYLPAQNWVFGTVSSTIDGAAVYLSYFHLLSVRGFLPYKPRLAFMSVTTSFGPDFRAGVLKYLNDNPTHFDLVFNEVYDPGVNAHVNAIARMKAIMTPPDIILIPTTTPEFPIVFATLSDACIRAKIVSFGPRGYEAVDTAHQARTAGLQLHSNWSPMVNSPANLDLMNRWRAARGSVPTALYGPMAYLCMKIIGDALNTTNTADPVTLRDYINRISYPQSFLPGGTFSFNSAHQSIAQVVINQMTPERTQALLYDPGNPTQAANPAAVAAWNQCGVPPASGASRTLFFSGVAMAMAVAGLLL